MNNQGLVYAIFHIVAIIIYQVTPDRPDTVLYVMYPVWFAIMTYYLYPPLVKMMQETIDSEVVAQTEKVLQSLT
jgi:hypothetical protein